MNVRERHHVQIVGRGKTDLVFAHGYGCDQNMWRLVTPAFEDHYRIILFDLVGSGGSDLGAYDKKKYATLDGHAHDVLEIIDEVANGPVVFVGHSVSAMIGLLADIAQPSRFAAHAMIGPSPRYIDDEGYRGGFTHADIASMLDTLESNYLGWASAMAPTIMGAPDRPELGEELKTAFCRTDPENAKHFARVTFLGDNRADVPKLTTRTLIAQSSDDIIAPLEVGQYLEKTLPNGSLKIIENIGHCPHLSAPRAIVDVIREFLSS